MSVVAFCRAKGQIKGLPVLETQKESNMVADLDEEGVETLSPSIGD